jgi:hypothetical protein
MFELADADAPSLFPSVRIAVWQAANGNKAEAAAKPRKMRREQWKFLSDMGGQFLWDHMPVARNCGSFEPN